MSIIVKEMLKGKRVVLASASPRRKELMRLIADSFEIIPAQGEETAPEGMPASDIPVLLAEQKCREVCSRCEPDENTVVIGCDTLVIAPNGAPLGKPADDDDALRMLRMLGGAEHSVVSGVCVYYRGDTYCFSQLTRVRFYEASDAELAAYISSGEPEGKAGAYAIQGIGGLLVESFEGDYNNVVGLPVSLLARKLADILGGKYGA